MGDRTAQVLSARLDELAAIAVQSGASPRAIARLLEAASVATLNAVALEHLAEPRVRAVADAPPVVAAPLRDAA
jgi:hypothetical protein